MTCATPLHMHIYTIKSIVVHFEVLNLAVSVILLYRGVSVGVIYINSVYSKVKLYHDRFAKIKMEQL